MNMFQLQERLKDFSKDQLVREMQLPSGTVPPFLVLSELQRRTRMEKAFQAEQGQQEQKSTVAQDAVVAAGLPQEGLAGIAQALAPKTDMAQNSGAAPVQGMAEGGMVDRRMQPGGLAGVSPTLPTRSLGGAQTIQELIDIYGAPATNEEMQMLLQQLQRNRALADGPIPVARPNNLMDEPEEAPRMERPTSVPNLGPALSQQGGLDYETPEFSLPSLDIERMEELAAESPYVQGLPIERSPVGGGAETTPLPIDTGTPLTIPEGGIEELLPPVARPETQIETPQPGGGAGGGAGGGGRGGAGRGRMDSDRMLEQDKWLALAQFGLGLMGSQQPTFGGAIGEAGAAALGQLNAARAAAVERDLANRTLAARTASASRSAGPNASSLISLASGRRDAAREALTLLSDEGITNAQSAQDNGRLAEYQAAVNDLTEANQILTGLYDRVFGSSGVAPEPGLGFDVAD